MCVGASGLLLNGLCYLLIGGKYALVTEHTFGDLQSQADASLYRWVKEYRTLGGASM
jgi:hypothetical protein